MIPLSTSVIHGLLICIPFTIFVAVSFLGNPRLWLHSLPKDIQRKAAPKTPREQMLTRYVLLPSYLVILPGLSIMSTVMATRQQMAEPSFVNLLTHLYIVWITVHLWDLLVIDALGLVLINPDRPPIKGTEGSRGWRDPLFHVRSFAIASIMSALFVVPAAAMLNFLL